MGLLEATGLTIEFPAVEPEIAPIANQVPAIEAKVPAIVADLIAVLTNVSVIGERCLSLGSNGGEE